MKVKMYDEEYEICHESCSGYEKVISKIDPLVNKFARKLCAFGLDFEDSKQEVLIILIEGIKNYDEEKEVKLSTFLHVHINNKVISKMKTLSKKSRCATLSKEGDFAREIAFSKLSEKDLDGYVPISSFTDFHYDEDKLHLQQIFDEVESMYGQQTSELLYLVSIEGYTKIAAAKILNINSWTASNKLKKLAKDPRIVELLKQLWVKRFLNT